MHSQKFQDATLLIVRIIVAAVFLYVGAYGKLFIWSTAPEGMPGAMVLLTKFLCIVEFIGGVALIAGFLTRLASLGLGIIMIGALFFLRMTMLSPLFTGAQGTGLDYNILILAGCIVLMAFGAGKWSVDAKMKRV